MRSSSVKTLVVSLSLIAAVSFTAEARPAQSSRPGVAPRTAVSRAVEAYKAIRKRVIGIIDFALAGPPLPAPTDTTTTTIVDPLSPTF